MTQDQSTHEDSKSQPPAEKTQNITSLVTAFTLLGGAGILVAAISLIRALPSGLSDVQLTDSVFNAVFGILFLIYAQMLAKGKAWVIWLVGSTILASIIYSFVMERGFNLIIAIIGVYFLWRLITLKRKGK
jgi:riboflavin transporter FmnP